ncbi:MAG: hypothetical protein WBA51_18600 [Erythrobacter sp.]
MTFHSQSNCPALTFVIPVRHQANAKDWKILKANLQETVASIANQTSTDWQGVVVANEGADLPPMPPRFQVERVQFAPNRIHEKGTATRDEFLDAFRIDKGQRVLAGMLATPKSRYFMIVDDDDFVSNRLVAFVKTQPALPGWVIRNGYVWNDGGTFLYAHDDFNHICGSSLIIESALYNLPIRAEDASREFIMQMLGSHHGIDTLLSGRGLPLTPLPFRGAVYRVAHQGSHSQTPGFLRKYVFANDWHRHPQTLFRNLRKIRRLRRADRLEFFSKQATA